MSAPYKQANVGEPDKLVGGSDAFMLGANSYALPYRLNEGQYIMGENVQCRGGEVMTRPGSEIKFNMPQGTLQGMTLFRPASGIAHLVFAVNGKVYVSQYPFTDYRQLDDLQFSVISPQLAWATCLKTTDYDAEGNIIFLDNPYSVLVMQDGLTRAAYWDGAIARHLNPTPSNTEFTPLNRDETPIGLWMAWSNNRLWVSRGNQVFASDIGNPLKFTETQYINEGRAFYLPGNCTGIIEVSEQQGIMCFTAETGTFIKSSVQDRTQWLLAATEMQKTTIPNIGCVAPRSLVNQYGLTWWYSAKGLINLNDALRINITSRLDIQDNEMFYTKSNMSYKLSGVCGTFYENMLLESVPNGDKFNTHTMVLDQAPFEGNVNAWCGFWTGWRPVEFGRGVIEGEERCFFASVDFDGRNRMWELFTANHTDNGLPITAWAEFREDLFGNRDYKRWRYAELEVRDIMGDVSMMAAVAGIRGAFQTVMRKDMIASIGQVYYNQQYGYQANLFAGSRPQTRILKTEDDADATDCNSECIESKKGGLIDKGFTLMVCWSGRCGISAYRSFCQSEPTPIQGGCEENEEGPNMLNDQSCGIKGLFGVQECFETFEGTYTYTKDAISYTVNTTSKISQGDADRRARLAAEYSVLTRLGEL